MDSDSLGLLETETDPKNLFQAFSWRYNHYNAKTVFPWASKYFMFDKQQQRGEMAKGPKWIKDELADLDMLNDFHTNIKEYSVFCESGSKNQDAFRRAKSSRYQLSISIRLLWLVSKTIKVQQY